MGEIADMMLDGTLCQDTGEYLGEAVGYPRSAPYLKRERRAKGPATTPPKERRYCGACGKRVGGDQGMRDHVRDAHKILPTSIDKFLIAFPIRSEAV